MADNSGKFSRIVSFILLICFVLAFACGCSEGKKPDETTASGTKPTEITYRDYVSELTLNMYSETVKQEVTVKSYVDGDTTHFYVPESVSETGVLKARYLAINTPESTGKIEEYGKAASNFTKEKLMNADSIIVESDSEKWNIDSTGSRYLVWVWYKPHGETNYRNLNLEILQNGLALASSTANNRYGDVCMSALNQAKAQKLKLYSGEKDPDFYYGEAIELTLKEIRLDPAKYEGSKVAFEGVVTTDSNNSIYLEDYDAETDMYYGMTVYYGFNLNGVGLDIISVGNRARIVGTVQYYETGDIYQVAGLSYSMMHPDDPSNLRKISEGNSAAYVETSPEKFVSGMVSFENDDGETAVRPYSEMALYTTICMKGLRAEKVIYSSDDGEMTILCKADDGTEIQVRTEVLRKPDGKIAEEADFIGKNMDIKGIVDIFAGNYQIKVFSYSNITFNN